MYFSEALADLRTHLYTDNGEGLGVDFNVNRSVWRLMVDKGFDHLTLRDMVKYLHSLFYLGEEAYLIARLQSVDGAERTKRTSLTLKTVDRVGA